MADMKRELDGRELDGIEECMLELEGARAAGVHDSTRIDAAELVCRPLPLSRRQRRWIIGQIAAAIVLAIGVGGFLFQWELGNIRDRVGQRMLASAGGCDGSFMRCLSGPKDVALSKCSVHDYDADGDVDLNDFGAYQLACVGPVSTR